MEKEFASYEQAVALKELGLILDNNIGGFYAKPNSKMFSIDEKGRYYRIRNATKKIYIYGTHFVLNDKNVFDAPLKQQVFRWFREKYGLHIGICHQANNKFDCWTNGGYLLENGKYCDFDTYEEAESACIDKLIELAKQQ